MNTSESFYWRYQFHRAEPLGRQKVAVEYVAETPILSVTADLSAPDSYLREYFRQNLPTRDVDEFAEKDPNGALLFLGYIVALQHCLLNLGEFIVHEQPSATAYGKSKPSGLGTQIPAGRGVKLWLQKPTHTGLSQ